jgi:transposase
MAMVDAHGLPIAICTASASPNEVTLVQLLFEFMLIAATPLKLIADKAYDSDKLDQQLQQEGVELIAPNRANRFKSQDGRALRRYRRRWKIERFFAWLQSFRRVTTRWDYHIANFMAFLRLACVVILMRHL